MSLSKATVSGQPPKKRRRLNRNNNHNHNHNTDDDENEARNHPYYQRLAGWFPLISPHSSCDFDSLLGDGDDDVMIMGDSKSKDAQIRKLKKQIAELKEKLNVLKKLATSSFEPQYNCIPVDKNNGISSNGIAQIKKKLMAGFAETVININITNRNHKQYKKAIITFIKRNKNLVNQRNNSTDPYIAVALKPNNNNNQNRVRYNYEKQQLLLCLRNDNERDSNGDFVESRVDNNMANTFLFATENIIKNCVIGEYHGLLMTEQEFEDIYHNSNKKELANLYAFEQDIDVEEIDGNNVSMEGEDDEDDDDDDEENESDILDMRKAIDEIRKGNGKFIIDAIGYQSYRSGEDHLLMYVKPVIEQDKKEANIEYVTAVVNGWPRIFAVTKERIKRDKIICGYFGAAFEMAQFETLREKRRRVRLELLVDSIRNMPMFVRH